MSAILNQFCRSIELKSNTPNTFFESQSLHIETWSIPSHRWEVEYKSNPINGTENQRKMWVFLNSLKSGSVEFDWEIPIHSVPQGSAHSNAMVFQDYNAGVTEFRLLGTLGDNFLIAGDLLKFSNHNKVYMVVEDVSGTNPIVKVNCPLKHAVTSSTIVITRNVAFKMILKPNTQIVSYSRSVGSFSEPFSAQFIEKL
ncbi:hypothetical protein [Catenovulum sediminis]|uniref:Uncharacterized protein n=1 Tax=Catenovulum sediminis TaxID=1740262 RepID=A0ABV1RKS6_9ALTE|nr:hypothetical protein [Catenovulum sediminis]